MGNAPAASAPRGRRAVRFAARHPWAMAFALLLTATLAARLGWGWRVGRLLAEQREEFRRRGQPVDPADVRADALPDAENAWTLIGQAFSADTNTSPANTTNTYPDYPPFNAAWDAAATASERSNGAVFRLAREARSRPRAQTHVGYRSPFAPAKAPTAYSAARQVATTLGDGALFRHVGGDDAEAVDRLLDMVHIARSAEQDESVIGQLVGLGIWGLAQQRAQVVAPGLRTADAAVRRRARELVDALLDDRASAERFGRGLYTDRLDAAEVQKVMSAGTWAIRPLSEREVTRANADHAVYPTVAWPTNAAAGRRALAALPDRSSPAEVVATGPFGSTWKVPDYTGWFAGVTPRPIRYFDQWYRNLGDRRATAVGLAARLYQVDHDGRWPDRLADLVPAYLPAVPIDPYHEDGTPLGYAVRRAGLPDGRDRPLVYYDEGDLADEAALVGPEPMYGWQLDPRAVLPPGRKRRDPIRQYRDLARWKPADRRFERERAAEAAEEAATRPAPAADDPAAREPPARDPATVPTSRPTGHDDPQ